MRPATTSSRARNNLEGRSRLPTTSVWAVIIRMSSYMLHIACYTRNLTQHVTRNGLPISRAPARATLIDWESSFQNSNDLERTGRGVGCMGVLDGARR